MFLQTVMMFPLQKKAIAMAKVSGFFFLPFLGFALLNGSQVSFTPARADATLLQLSPVFPDESVGETLQTRFSLPNALERLQQTRGALSSFTRLTENSRGANNSALSGLSNTDWETQNLGFVNWTGAIEGTLRHQHYQLKKLELELARKQYQDGEISQTALKEKQIAHQRAEQEFQAFWATFHISD